jgi:hypothetical protein
MTKLSTRKFAVIRYWEMRDEVTVEAIDEESAIDAAHALPFTKGEYVNDSMNSDIESDVQEV